MRVTKRSIYLIALLVIGIGAALLSTSRSTATPRQAENITVTMKDFEFAPKDITVHVGDSVTWNNTGTKKHTATADDGSFDTAVVAPNAASQPIKFDKPGTYAYYCQFHGGPGGVDMAGTITVAADAGAPAATQAPAAAPAAAAPVGTVAFADKAKNAHADSVTVTVSNIPLPEEGKQYEIWLADGKGTPFSLGKLDIKADGTGSVSFADPKGTNLINLYNTALVTLQGEDLATAGPVVYSGAIPPKADIHVRHVMGSFPDTPDKIGLVIGAFEQEAVLTQHVAFMNDALAKNNVALAKLHMEHIHNLMTGNNGAKDLNGDGKLAVIPPGDGFGIFTYLSTAVQHADLAAKQPDATNNIKVKANHVKITAANASTTLSQIQKLVLDAATKKTVAEIKPIADQITKLNATVVKGNPDASGGVSPTKGSGGLGIAYNEGLAMATIALLPGDAALQGAGAAAPPAAPPAAATVNAAAPAAAADTVTVVMKDFEFADKAITITAGQSVVFANQGTKKHTATADDNSFDTGVVAPGTSSAPVKFDKPGTYPYYCQFHGGPGGVDMSGTITVK
ncbi:MAG: cupredoxin domain-containing protein [Chloroflexota bacterium]